MKKLIDVITVVIPVICFSANVHAQDVTSFSHDVEINATVPKICSFQGQVDGYSEGSTLDANNETSVLALEINNQTSEVNTALAELTFTNAMCNIASDVTLTRQGLNVEGHTETTEYASGFTGTIDYIAKLTWGQKTIQLIQGNKMAGDSFGPLFGNIVLRIDIDRDQNSRLVEGKYSDVLSLSIVPEN